MPIIYLKSCHRRPVRLKPSLFRFDRQADVPFGWCGRCGKEVYVPLAQECPDCRKRKEVSHGM